MLCCNALIIAPGCCLPHYLHGHTHLLSGVKLHVNIYIKTPKMEHCEDLSRIKTHVLAHPCGRNDAHDKRTVATFCKSLCAFCTALPLALWLYGFTF